MSPEPAGIGCATNETKVALMPNTIFNAPTILNIAVIVVVLTVFAVAGLVAFQKT
jgi:hypothetical protein